jgi:hypothetical protein
VRPMLAGLTSTLRSAALVVAAMALLACGGSEVTGTAGAGSGTSGGGTGSGGGNVDSGLVGRWTRTIYFYDEFGGLHSSRTEWTFAADGSAARTVTATNWSDGWSDATVSLARWRTEAGEVVITYQLPDAGTARFAYRFENTIDGPLLWLGATAFFRVTP